MASSDHDAHGGSLTGRRAAFVREYLVDNNGTQAAIRAGYKPRSARIQAAQLLTNPNIQEAIAKGQKQIALKAGLRAERVIEEFARIAFSDIANYLSWGPHGVILKSSHELTEAETAAVLEVRETRRTIPQRKGPPIEQRRVSFKLHPKVPALDSLAKHLGLFREEQRSSTEDVAALGRVIYAVLEKFLPPQQLEMALIEIDRALGGHRHRERLPGVTSTRPADLQVQ